MRQLLTVFAAMLVLASAGGLYLLKHKVEARRDQVLALERQIMHDSEALRVLEAEWAYLASPQLVQDQAVRYLRLRPATPDQVVTSLAVLPYRLDHHVLAAVSGDDIQPVPSPRSKPVAPTRPDDHRKADVLMASGETTPPGQPSVLSNASYSLGDARHRQPRRQDFGARMQQAIDRVGGDQ